MSVFFSLPGWTPPNAQNSATCRRWQLDGCSCRQRSWRRTGEWEVRRAEDYIHGPALESVNKSERPANYLLHHVTIIEDSTNTLILSEALQHFAEVLSGTGGRQAI